MSNISISLKNQARIVKAFKDAPEELAKAIQDALFQTGGELVGKTKLIVEAGTDMWKPPVDTRTMKNQITIVEHSPLKVVISPNYSVTPYAKYIIQGTSRMQARHFLDITTRHEAKNIQEFFQRTLNNFVNKLASKI